MWVGNVCGGGADGDGEVVVEDVQRCVRRQVPAVACADLPVPRYLINCKRGKGWIQLRSSSGVRRTTTLTRVFRHFMCGGGRGVGGVPLFADPASSSSAGIGDRNMANELPAKMRMRQADY